MQFYLNGFHTGDPELSAPDAVADRRPGDEIDVLIVGAGPAGLTLASQLAAFPDIRTRVFEQKPERLSLGQADGIACRTMEMFEAFGFADRVLKEGYWVNETVFWKPRSDQPGAIARSGRVQDVEDGLSEMPHVILNQARVHDFYLDVMAKSPSRLVPDYSRRLLDVRVDRGGAYPVTAQFERTDPEHQGQVETIQARYLVGCDGARSAVRRSIGLTLDGDSANQAWGVMDVLVVTDFPDIRFKAVIQSACEGNILIIPREGGYLVRLYIELDPLAENERVASKNITVEHLIATAQRIMRPYILDVKEVAWWSVYEIGQRICHRFDDRPDDDQGHPHVFIAGDACHTHSPKAGQGMNVSMQDAFNLGWKLASVIRGQATPAVLATYSPERQAAAQALIDFDRKFAKMFSAPPKLGDGEDDAGVDPAEFQSYFKRQGRFTAGVETHYRPSLISAEPRHQDLAKGLTMGRRFHSAPVMRFADAKQVHLGHILTADGRWRLLIFADPLAERAKALCGFLAEAPNSPVRRYTPPGSDTDCVFDVRAIFQPNHQTLTTEDLPALLTPQKGRYGLRDHEKIFCAPLKDGPDIFELRGVDRAQGCAVVVRPDQYVANVLPLTAHAELASFFAQFMVTPTHLSSTSVVPITVAAA